MSNTQQYKWWQVGAFWFTWLVLLFIAYGAALTTYFIGSMLPDYHQPQDIGLVVIFALALLAIVGIAVYTGWHYWQRTQSYAYLMSLVLITLVVIPLLVSSGAVYILTQMSGVTLELPTAT